MALKSHLKIEMLSGGMEGECKEESSDGARTAGSDRSRDEFCFLIWENRQHVHIRTGMILLNTVMFLERERELPGVSPVGLRGC